MVKGRWEGRAEAIRPGGKPLFRFIEQPAVHIPADAPGKPLQREGVEIRRKVPLRQSNRPLALLVGQAVVECAVVRPGLVAQDLTDVDLAADGPLAPALLVPRHQPEGREKPFSPRNLQAGLENPIGKLVLSLGGNPSGTV